MEEPEHIIKGTTSYRYPAISQIAILAGFLLLIGVFIEMLQTAREIDPTIKTTGTVILSICYVVILVWVLAKPKGKQKQFITSVEALPGSYTYRKTWPLIAGFYTASFTLGVAVNGFLFLAIIIGSIFLLVIIISKIIKSGIRIDGSGNLYVLRQNNETLVRFEYASEVSFRFYSRFRSNNLEIIFGNTASMELPSRLVIYASRLRSDEFGTYLDPGVLSNFVKEKCASLGFKIENTSEDEIYAEWIAKK